MQYGGGYAVRWRVCSTMEAHYQDDGGCAVRTCHIFSMVEGVRKDLAHHQHGVGCAVRIRMCKTGLLKLLRGLLAVAMVVENDILQTILP